jgi:subtilisin family serine protease
LADSYRGRNGDHNYNWLDAWYGEPAPYDLNGHGTHTTATVVGDRVGVAPDAEWFACANLVRNLGNPGDYLDCMQFMLAPTPLEGDPFTDGDTTLAADVLNNSWGCPALEGCDPGALQAAVTALRAAGIFVVASAGNEGQGGCGTVEDPIALYAASFTVGAHDRNGVVASFSSRGAVTVDGSHRTKPDLLAPGVGVTSAWPRDRYATHDGTSMAGPHVAGVVLLMWSANPGLIGDIAATEQILEETATPYDYRAHGTPQCGDPAVTPDDAVGYGLVDAYQAVQAALAQK